MGAFFTQHLQRPPLPTERRWLPQPPGTCLETLAALRDRCDICYYGNSWTTWVKTLRENISQISGTWLWDAVFTLCCFCKLCKGYLSILSCSVRQVFPLGKWTTEQQVLWCNAVSQSYLKISIVDNWEKRKCRKHSILSTLASFQHVTWWIWIMVTGEPKQLLYAVMIIIEAFNLIALTGVEREEDTKRHSAVQQTN